MANSPEQLQRIFEAALMVAGRPLTIADLQKLFDETEQPDAKFIREILQTIQESYNERSVELREVASGFQFQAKSEYSPWLSRLWEERAPRFTRAFLETVALIAYRQPITRAEIEEIRGVTVSTNIIKTLQEREWIRVIGHRDVPGKPALYGTTKTFLDHLNLQSLDQLPPLSELVDIDGQEEKLHVQLELGENTDSEIEAERTETISAKETMAEDEHPESSSPEDEEEHEHSDTCSHAETDLKEDEEEHEHTELGSHEDEDQEEHEHSDTCSHAETDLEENEAEHEHTESCSHDDTDEITRAQYTQDDDEDDITSDPYPKETAEA